MKAGTGVIILLLGLSIAGFAKKEAAKEKLPPLPTWDPLDEELVEQGEIVPGMDLFRTDLDEVELPVPPPVTPDPDSLTPIASSVTEEDIPGEISGRYHEFYFGQRPASYLMDPQELLSRQEFRDRESFLDYHAADSEISLYIYLFDAEQDLPQGVSAAEVLRDQFVGTGSTALVFYYLGMPERSEMVLSEDIASVISREERAGALRSAINDSLEKSEPSDQLHNFSVELSIRLFWFERAMSGAMLVPVSGGAVGLGTELGSSRLLAARKGLDLGPMRHIVYGVGFLVLAAGLGWFGRIIGQRRARYVFPKVDTGPLLGAPHAAGVGAVISFRSTEVPPSQQREEVPDYLQRM